MLVQFIEIPIYWSYSSTLEESIRIDDWYLKKKLLNKLIWSKTEEEKLRWLHEQVIEVNASIVKVFLLRKLSHGTHEMGWD